MKKTAKLSFIFLLFAAILLTSFSYQSAKAYAPPYTTIKVGLYYGGTILPSANLQNVTGYGSGFQYGIIDQNRQFVPLTGAATSETRISVIRDKNMAYDSSDNSYTIGLTGQVVVGCYHIQLNTTFTTYAVALASLSTYKTGFVKYSNGVYDACIGSYISADDANAAITAGKIADCAVTCGSTSTVTVVKTGTNTVLFQFEYGSSSYLVIMPVPTNGTKSQTWFKGLEYYGGFEYARFDGTGLSVINIVNIEDYVKGVIPYEMSNSWPIEALKAQAVCARTYVIANLDKHTVFDVCTTEDDQVYFGVGQANATTDMAVDQTAGQFATYNGALCTTYYASSDGGATENSENVWAEAVPYLRGVADPYEADIALIASGYKWNVTYSPADITSRLHTKGYNCGNIVSMVISQYTDMGNVYKVTLTDDGGKKFTFTKGDSIRSALGLNSIRFSINNGTGADDIFVNDGISKVSGGIASNYAVGQSGIPALLGQTNVYAITGSGDTVAVGNNPAQTSAPAVFTIRGTGNGHSIGMSQWGAYSMAKYHNMTYDQILKFYFTGVTIA